MNKRRYRVIFNIARGQLMVVQENARSCGKQTSEGGGSNAATGLPFTATLQVLTRILAVLGVTAWFGGVASAQVVADRLAPGNQQPTVLNTANGVLQVNIQSPSAAGVSRNTYTQFDVPGSGVVLNNSRTQAQTQLGGWVRGNPWLAKGEARVILNEVMRANAPSQLRGFIEVGGARADVIIANPAGIDVAGSGFINVGRATLTTGVPMMSDGNIGNLDAYAVTRGHISVSGAGLDASQTDYTDLIARSVEINAGVWAKQLSVTVGANQVGADIGAVPTAIQGDAGARPTYAIDVGQLGGMYANKIFLVGTEAGVGVRNAGNIGAAAGEVVLSANGSLSSTGSIAATTGVALRTWGNLDQNGVLRSDAGITVDASGTLSNRGEIQADGAIALTSQQDIDNQGKVYTPTQLTLDAQGKLGNSGSLSGQSGVKANAARVANSGVISSDREVALTVRGELDNRTGTIQARRLAIDAQGSVENRQGKIIQNGSMALAVNAVTLLNTEAGALGAPVVASTEAGSPIATDNPAQGAEPGVPSSTTPDTGETPTAGNDSAQTGNTSTVAPEPAGFLRSAGTIGNQAGEISANGPIDLTLQQLDNSAGALSVRSLSVTGQQLANRQGRLNVADTATVRVAEMDNTGGKVLVGRVFDGQIGQMDNRKGLLQAGRVDLAVAGNLNNDAGVLRQTSAQDARISVGGVFSHDAGLIEAPGNVILSAGSMTGEKGTITVLGDLNVQSGATSSRDGTWTVAGVADITTAGLDNTGGAISAGVDTRVRSASLDNIDGSIGAKRDVSIDAKGYIDNRDGYLQAGRNMSVLATGTLVNSGGTVEALAPESRLSVSAGDIDNRLGRIVNVGVGDTTVTAQNSVVNSGKIAGNGAVTLGGQTLENQAGGDIVSGQDMSLAFKQSVDNAGWIRSGGTLDALEPAARFSNKGVVFSAEQMHIEASLLDNSGGQMATATAGGGDIVLNAGELANRGGSIVADRDALLSTTGAADNSSGTIQARRNLSMTVGSTLKNRQGAIETLLGNSVFTLSAQDIENTGGRLVNAGVGDTDISSQTGILNSGAIAGQGKVNLRADSIDNLAAGVIVAGGDLELAARRSLVNAGAINTSGDLSVGQATANVSNQGAMFFAGDASVRAASFNNDGGKFASVDGTAGTISMAAQSLSNQAGLIVSGGAASFDIGAVDPVSGLASGAGTFNNSDGVVQAAGTLDIQATGALTNDRGLIESTGRVGVLPTTLTIQAASISNLAGAIGNVGKGDSAIRADGAVVSSGSIASNGALTITAGSIEHLADGKIVTGGDLSLSARDQLSNAGLIQSGGRLDLGHENADVANQGKIFFSGDASVRVARFNNDSGIFAGVTGSTGNITIAAQSLSNQAGMIVSGGQAGFDIGAVDPVSGMASGPGTFNNQDGVVQAADALDIQASGALDNTRGLIETKQSVSATPNTLSIRAASIGNQAGQISNVDTGKTVLDVDKFVTNSGLIAGNGTVAIVADTIDNLADGKIMTAADLSLEVRKRLSNAGAIRSVGNLSVGLPAADVDNQGKIFFGGNASVQAAQFNNDGGQFAGVTGTTGNIAITAQTLSNRAGLIVSGGKVGLDIGAVDPVSGMASGLGTIDNRDGLVQAAGSLAIQASGALNNDQGLIETKGAVDASTNTLTIQAASISNLAGAIGNVGTGETRLRADGALISSGTIAANGMLVIDADTIVNRVDGKMVTAADLNLSARTQLTNAGQIHSAGKLDFSQAGAGFANRGKIFFGGDASVTAARFNNDGGQFASATGKTSSIAIAAQDLSNRGGTIAAGGEAAIDIDARSGTLAGALGAFDNTDGVTQAAGSLRVSASGVLTNDRGLIETAGTFGAAPSTLRLDAAAIVNQAGQINNVDTGDTVLQAVQSVTNSGVIAGNGAVALNAQTLRNEAAGVIASAGAMRFSLAQEAYNAGQVSSAGTFDFQQAGAALVNRGNIVAANAVRIAVASVNNAGGKIATATGSGADLTLSAGSLDNQAGKLLSDRDLGVTIGGAIDNRGGAMQAARDARVSAGGTLNNDAGTIEATGPASVLQLQGQSVSNLGGRIVNAGTGSTNVTGTADIVNSGVIAGNGVLGLSALQLDNRSGGSIASAGALDLGISQRAENRGTIESGGTLSFNQSGAQLVNSARIASRGAINMQLNSFQNSGNISTLKLSGASIDIDSQVIDNRGGTVTADGKASITSRSTLDNKGGTLQSGTDMSVSATGRLDNDGVIEALGGASTMTVKADAIANGTGRIVNLGTGLSTVTSQGSLSNGGMIGGNGDLTLSALTLDNQSAGTVFAKAALALDVTQQVDNAGLIQSGGTLTFNEAAAGLKNTGRIEAAGNAVIVTDHIVNDGGKIGTARDSDADLSLTTGAFSSAGGQIATDRDLKVDVKDLQAAGELTAGRDLSLTLVGDYTHTAGIQIKSGRDIALDVSGKLTNTATLEAVRDLDVSANYIENQAGATIRADGLTLVSKTDLVNAGEINANKALNIEANRVVNTTAIIGETLTLKAGILDNTGSAALVGGVNQVSLWVAGDLNNKDGATIYSGGDMVIAANASLGRSGRVTNQFSTIEAAGTLDIATDILENLRDEVKVTQVTTLDQEYAMQFAGWHQQGPNENKYDPASANYRPQEIYYVNPADILESTEMYTPYGEKIWKVTYQTHENDSAFFRATSGQFGAHGQVTRIAGSAGTRTAYVYQYDENASNPDQVGVGDPWNTFAASRPITWHGGTPALSSSYGSCGSNCIRLVAEPGYTDPTSTTLMHNMLFLGTSEDDKEATRIAHHTAVDDQILTTGGAPSQILSGGNMRLNVGQSLNNEYATIAAVGTLTIEGTSNVVNKGVTLYRKHTFDGSWTTGGGTTAPLASTSLSQKIGIGGGVISGGQGVSITARSFANVDVSAGTAANLRSNVIVAGSGTGAAGSLGGGATANGFAAGNASGAGAQGSGVGINAGLDLTNGSATQGSGAGINVAANGMAQGSGIGVNAAAGADVQGSGVGANASLRSVSNGNGRNTSLGDLNARGGSGIVGDARLGAGQSLDAQGRAGAIVDIAPSGLFRQNTGGGGQYLLETRSEFASRDTWLGSDYILAALNTDPTSMQKRLGDGFYEQRLVREQLLALTGKVIGAAGDDSAYQAMLNSGISYAQQWDLRPGIALTAEQIAQLTSDIVWLENQTVRLPDGSTHTVLAPKVYVAQVGDKAVSPSGALVTGKSVEIYADQITNQGGLIDGGNGRTVLVASNDISNLGGAIRGGNVELYAGRDVRNESLVVSDTLPGQTRVMASNQASITASGDLTVSAARDVIDVAGLMSAGRGAAGGDATVSAGRDLVFSSQALVDNYSVSGAGGLSVSESLTHRRSQLDTGGDLSMLAGRDLTLTGAQIAIGTNPEGAGYEGIGSLQAGRNLSLNAVTDSYANRTSNGTDPKNSSYIGWSAESVTGTQIVSGSDLTLKAGTKETGNISLAASALASGGLLSLDATGDIQLNVVEQTKDYAHQLQSSSSGFLSKRSSTSIVNNSETLAIGSSLSGKQVLLDADRDISIEGGRVVAQDGLTVKAGRDLVISSAEERSSADSFLESRRSGFFVGSFGVGYAATKASDAGDGTSVTQRGSLLSGDNVHLEAGRDLGILGSTVVAESDLKLKAGRDIDIVSTQNRAEQSNESHRSESGVLGKFGRPSVGTISVNQDGQSNYVEQVGSMVGSLGGNVNVEAGGTYTQTASEVNAAAGFANGANNPTAGNITIRAGEVLINEAMNTTSSQQHTSQRKTAIGPQLDMPLLNAAKSLRDVAQAAGETSDTRSQAMAAATMAMQASDIASGVQGAAADPRSLKNGLKLTFALGSSRSESSMSQQSETSVGSTVRGSGNVSITATGVAGELADGGTTGNIKVVGSQVQAGGTVALTANDRIDLLASKDSFTQTSNSRSSGASVGIGIAFGGDQKGFTLELAANRARANADGTDTIYRNTHIEGGSGVTLTSGGDTTLRGATITAPTVSGTIGGDLTITSLQDVSRFDSKQSSAGMSASLCIYPFCTGASYGSGSVSRSTVDGDFTSVTETSGIRAGDGGFQVKVGGNTALNGGVIASSDKAVNDNKNLLQTATLTTSDLRNRDVYEASGYSFSASVGSNKPSGAGGVGNVDGAQESVTRAGVSGGAIVISDGAAQQTLTGKSVEEVLASLDRDVTSGTADAGVLLKSWDAARLQREVDAQVKITAEFGKVASKAAGEYATRKASEARGVNNEEEALKWDEGGEYRIALHGGIGLLTGGVQGAVGALTSAKLMPVLGEEIAGMNLPKPVSDALMMAAGAGLGAVAGGVEGAAAGLNETANNYVSRSPFASVRRMASVENARLTNACGADCTKEDFARNDALVRKLEMTATLAATAQISSLTLEQMQEMSQFVIELAPFYGNAESFAQLLTGKSSITGEEASRFWAAIGVVPVVGGMVRNVAGPSLSGLKVVLRGADGTVKTADKGVDAARHLAYDAAPYHGKTDNLVKSRAPINGQEALNTSVQVKDTSPRRIGIDYNSGEFVVFDRTQDATYHGHVRSWGDLHPDMQRALQQAGLADRKGKVIVVGGK